ncbi:MAG: hypothetical protein JWO53_303, partial [Chlamydiia bacterium]|nr:hypothetical protein [Chlamydiia bacterium]
LFPQIEILDVSENNLCFTVNLNGSTNTVLLPQLLPCKNLKKLTINRDRKPNAQPDETITIRNKITAADKQAFIDAFKEKNPRFELVES